MQDKEIKHLEELMEEMANSPKGEEPWPRYSTYAGEKAFVLTRGEHKLLESIYVGNVGFFPEALALAKKLKLQAYIDLYEEDLK